MGVPARRIADNQQSTGWEGHRTDCAVSAPDSSRNRNHSPEHLARDGVIMVSALLSCDPAEVGHPRAC
jgi:hypothetical protein